MRNLMVIGWSVVFAMLTVAVVVSCQASVGIGNQPPPPNALQQAASTILITAAEKGITEGISPKVERAYAIRKISYAEYVAARGEEQAALDALKGLQAKVDSGTPVTQAEINAATVSFVKPLLDLVGASTTLPPPATAPG